MEEILTSEIPTESKIAGNREKSPSDETDPYKESTAIEKLKENQKKGLPLRVAFLDIDSTLTGNPNSTNTARQKLEELGYVICFVTSRTEEMTMSEKEYNKSKDLGFKRPAPNLALENGKRVYTPAEEVYSWGILDPDIVAGQTGSEIMIKQKEGGYLMDKEFESNNNRDSDKWRTNAIRILQPILKRINPTEKSIKFAPIESMLNFQEGKTDVFPPNFRIQIDASGLEQKEKLLENIRELKNNPDLEPDVHKFVLNLRITDDSNPDKGRFSLYVTPNGGHKARAAETITNNLCKELGITQNLLDVLIAGDSFPDLAMGLYGAMGTKATFVVVGGSRLSEVLTSSQISEFAGEGLGAIKNRLKETNNNGCYKFRIPIFGDRTVIVADEAFPGKKGPDSIAAYLAS